MKKINLLKKIVAATSLLSVLFLISSLSALSTTKKPIKIKPEPGIEYEKRIMPAQNTDSENDEDIEKKSQEDSNRRYFM